MKYGARAIVWGHKVYKGKVTYADVPAKLKNNVNKYLVDKGYTSFITATDSLSFTASVTLSGADLSDNAFTFSLTGSGDVSKTAKNVAGNITFEPITYGNDDLGETYSYVIKQVAGSETGYTYDLSEYTAIVEISRNSSNVNDIEWTLVCKKTKDSTGNAIASESQTVADAIVFENSYSNTEQL